MATPVYEIQTNEIFNDRETGQWTNEVGDANEFATIAAAVAGIQSLRELDAEWAAGTYRVVEIESGDIEFEVGPGEDLELPTQLPDGWDSIEHMSIIGAGLMWLADRGLALDSIPEPTRYEFEPAHPECYVLAYPDDSAYVRSNADDEVWDQFSDYLSVNALHTHGDTIYTDE